ncbi:serine/threonine protein kinase [Mycobacterium barrassiae]|uniref:serine/threonine-protein kinase n=1 Tax=Mycobacterium barrassiae TaxID=319709 RepID=UPI002265D59A|nr:serine/threonine-protein kinase [Mycobacterium barrassiae]MCV7301664.1 serine/threonine protein kinase [Mycobacterium barrassiae]
MSDPEKESRVGTQIGPYRLRRLLGKGGMGEVYEAEDTVKDRIVALKLLPESASNDPVFRKRLQREAHSAGRLQEPHVVPIHDYGEIDGLLYVDMRMIEGQDLRKMLKAYGPLTPARAVAIVRQIASALDAAHESGVMHRDVKPENIIITRDDFAYLVDFGIANAATDEKLTELGTAVGTYAYMAPERFTRDEVTYRADIYALACVLHECLTGGQPYPGDSVSVIITAHLMHPIPKPSVERPGIPGRFDEVIARGMAKKPEDRYASAGDLAAAATAALTHREQDQAATILQRSEAATKPVPPTPLPGPPPYPISHTPPPGSPPTPGSYPVAQPPPPSGPRPVAFHTGPPPSGPIGPQVPSGPPSGPMWSATPAPPGPPQPPSSGGSKVPWIPLAAVAAVLALVLGGLGIWWMVGGDDSSTSGMGTSETSTTTMTSERTTRRTPRTTTPTQNPDSFESKLMSVLPRGYDAGVCEPASPPATGALATVDCGPASPEGGPENARYSLFADQGALDRAFDDSVAANSELVQCPNSNADSPTTWHYTETPDKVEGRIACGVFNGRQDVTWTFNEHLMLGDAQGPDLPGLHDWWLKFA